MTPEERVVIDSDALVSRLLLPKSIAGRAVDKALEHSQLLVSEATLEELADVLARPKFDPYVTIDERQQFLRLLVRISELVPVNHEIQACRDPSDDKFLELAVNGQAHVIVTGDDDLLTLDPFRGVFIITPAAFLKR